MKISEMNKNLKAAIITNLAERMVEGDLVDIVFGDADATSHRARSEYVLTVVCSVRQIDEVRVEVRVSDFLPTKDRVGSIRPSNYEENNEGTD